MKHAITHLLSAVVLITGFIVAPTPTFAAPGLAPMMDRIEEVATTQGFAEVSRRRPNAPFYGSKRANAKTWMTLEIFPKGKAVTQVALSCNQCKARKMSEELSIACFEETQNIAKGLGVVLPGATIQAFEGKEQEQEWEVKDQAVKKVRFQRTALKCDSGPSGSGIRFDFFY